MTSKGDKMHGQTHLLKRGSTYYFRVRIPPDLRSHYDEKWEIKLSLKTSDRREATHLCRLKAAEVADEFDRHRHQRDTAHGIKPFRKVTRIDADFIDQFKNRWLYEVLNNDDARRQEGLDREELVEFVTHVEETQKALESALARGDVAVIAPALHTQLHLLGIELDVPEADYRRFAFSYLQTLTEANRLIQQRNQGAVIETPKVVLQENAYPLHPKIANKPGLSELFDYWCSAIPRKSKTTDAFKATVNQFIDIVGDRPADELRKADFVKFKDELTARGSNHYKTIAKKLVHLNAILNHAVANDRLEVNPATSVKVVKPKVPDIPRLPFDIDDLKKIFASPLYVANDRPVGGAAEASVWLPLLSLFTGARINELGQLLVSDVLHTPVAGYFIHVIDEDDSDAKNTPIKTLKTASSRRKVPLHPELIKAGFIQYWDFIVKSGSDRLFPDLVPDCHGHITGNWSKWFSRYLRNDIKITEMEKVCHSFRHTFKDACRNAGLGEDVHDAFTGHASGSIGRGYGSGHSLRFLAKAIAKVKYPGLSIPVIHPPPPTDDSGNTGARKPRRQPR